MVIATKVNIESLTQYPIWFQLASDSRYQKSLRVMVDLVKQKMDFVVVTGPTMSGPYTTLADALDVYNER